MVDETSRVIFGSWITKTNEWSATHMDLAALTALTKFGFLNARTAVIIGFCHGMADLLGSGD